MESLNRKFRSPFTGKALQTQIVPLTFQCFQDELTVKEKIKHFRNLSHERQIKTNEEMKGSWMIQK